MKYRQLGQSALNISQIGFGCMSLGTESLPSVQLIHEAIANGINFFDTADLYEKGLNETMVGRALCETRKAIILATKVGNVWRPDFSGWDWKPSKQYILEAVESSLRRLQTDYIDLYQLHGGTMDDPIDDIIESFELLKKQGKIREYGISSIRPNVIRAYAGRSNMVSVMMQYSLLDRRPEEEMLAFLAQNNIGVLVRGAIARGLLVSKPPINYLNHNTDAVGKTADAVRQLSGHGRSAYETALQFVFNHPAVHSAVIGIRTAAQLSEAISGSDAIPLTEDEYRFLQNSIKPDTYTEHR